MAMTVLQTRVDSETKLAAENLFSSLGLDLILQLQSVYFYVVKVAFH